MHLVRIVGPVVLIGVIACSPKGGKPGSSSAQSPPAEQPAGSGTSGAGGGSGEGAGPGAGGGSTAGPGSAPGAISTSDPRAAALQRALRHRYRE